MCCVMLLDDDGVLLELGEVGGCEILATPRPITNLPDCSCNTAATWLPGLLSLRKGAGTFGRATCMCSHLFDTLAHGLCR